MLLPKRVKYRRVHRGRLTGKAYRGNKVTASVSVKFGLRFSQISRLQQDLLKLEWVKVKVTQNIG